MLLRCGPSEETIAAAHNRTRGELRVCGCSRPFELRVPDLDEAPPVSCLMARDWLWLLVAVKPRHSLESG